MAIRAPVNTASVLVSSTPTSTATNATNSIWLKVGTIGSTNQALPMYLGASASNGYGLFINGATRTIGSLFGGVTIGTASIAMSDSVWAHIAFTRNGTTYDFYKDGVFQSTETRTIVAPTNDFYFGGNNSTSNELTWAEAAHWQHTMTAADIAALAKFRPHRVRVPNRYWPCAGNRLEITGRSGTISTGNTVLADHPRIY